MPDARDAEDSRRNKKDMKIKKLAVEEKGRTRALWEEVFSEDTREFLDYYYFIKTRDNERLEETLADTLGAVVKLSANQKGKGRIVIEFSSLDQLQGIVDRIQK